ncbi:MAG: tetratricopeptide repeat protein, partial [Deltaproteobacteria bacterium]|nr:tetratricopeptide repeat protein [Deltaproteobacteria bacterium]
RVWAEQSNTTAGLRRLVVELDNLQAAYAHCAGGGADDPASASRRLALCLALDPVLSTRGPVDVHLERLDASLAEAARRASSEPELVARALAARGRLRKSRGWIPEALADLQEAASLARGAKLRALEARLDADMGEAHLAQGRMDEALAHFERALGARLVGRDRIVRGRALASLGLLHHGQGRLDRALDAYERAVAVLAELGDDVTRASVLKDIGSLRLQQGRHEEAEAIYRQSLALQRDLGDRRVLGVVLGNLGILAQERGRLEEARTSFERALAHVREVADRMLEGHLLGYLAGLGLERGDLAGARALYLEAIGVLREVGDRRLEGTFRACLGSIEASEGHIDAANEAFEGAETLLEGVGDPALLSACVIHRGHLDLAEARTAAGRGDGASADALRRRARARLDALRPPIDSDDLRFAARLLSRALGEGALVVAADTSWFRVPGGAPVSLETRKPLRFIVAALIERRLAQPGAALSTEALFAAGWPGERALPQASANRVKVALSSLRTMGLRAMLLHGEDGYSLDPAVPVTMEAPAQRP